MKLCDGTSRKTEERFGGSRDSVAKRLLERSGEPEKGVRFQRGGVKPSEVRNLQFAIDIHLIVELHNEAKDKLTTLKISVDTKSKVSLGEHVLGEGNYPTGVLVTPKRPRGR